MAKTKEITPMTDVASLQAALSVACLILCDCDEREARRTARGLYENARKVQSKPTRTDQKVRVLADKR